MTGAAGHRLAADLGVPLDRPAGPLAASRRSVEAPRIEKAVGNGRRAAAGETVTARRLVRARDTRVRAAGTASHNAGTRPDPPASRLATALRISLIPERTAARPGTGPDTYVRATRVLATHVDLTAWLALEQSLVEVAHGAPVPGFGEVVLKACAMALTQPHEQIRVHGPDRIVPVSVARSLSLGRLARDKYYRVTVPPGRTALDLWCDRDAPEPCPAGIAIGVPVGGSVRLTLIHTYTESFDSLLDAVRALLEAPLLLA